MDNEPQKRAVNVAAVFGTPEWLKEIEAWNDAIVAEMRRKGLTPGVDPIDAEARPEHPGHSDLVVMFKGTAGDSGEFSEATGVEWQSEKRELVEKILAGRQTRITTGL